MMCHYVKERDKKPRLTWIQYK